jgi:hypothetical protein
MSDYDGQSNCAKHGARRCMACSAGSRPKIVKPEYKEMLLTGPAPTEITGAPPPNIEDMTSDALRAEIALNVSPAVDEVWGDRPGAPIPGFKEVGRIQDEIIFEALPVDDSHASKVVRAAAEYASASKAWAQELARVTKIKQELLKAESELHAALVRKEVSECDLKTLVSGEAA